MENNLLSDDSSESSEIDQENQQQSKNFQTQPKSSTASNINITQDSNTSLNNKIVTADSFYKGTLRDPGIEGRKASRLIFLRTFNNWIKACIIKKVANKLGSELSVLDICCGRGGDLEKFFKSRVKLYVGADLSEESLRNALDRIEKLKNEKFNGKMKTKCYFIVEDVSNPKNTLMEKIDKNIEFDFVSCQFAMHYHFGSEQNIRVFLKNVSERLRYGGYFIGTIIDSNILVKRLRESKSFHNKFKNEKFTFGNDFYSVKFNQKSFDKSKPFGIKYGFFLEDSIDKRDEEGKIKYVGEFLIIFDEFLRIAKEYDLHFVEKSNFTEFYNDNIGDSFYRDLFKRIVKDIDNKNIEDQWEIIHLYMFFSLRKEKPDSKGKERSDSRKKDKEDSKDKYVPFLSIGDNYKLIKDGHPVLLNKQFD